MNIFVLPPPKKEEKTKQKAISNVNSYLCINERFIFWAWIDFSSDVVMILSCIE